MRLLNEIYPESKAQLYSFRFFLVNFLWSSSELIFQLSNYHSGASNGNSFQFHTFLRSKTGERLRPKGDLN